MNRPTRRLSTFIALALGAATLSAVATTGGTATAASDSAATAVSRLRADATGAVKLVRDRSGRVTFVGTDAGKPVDNPGVSRSTSVSAAARAHLDRYAAALGGKGSTLREHKVLKTLGGDVVRFNQEIGGVPVLGGDVVVTLSPDRELVSLLSTMSSSTKVAAATVTEEQAAQAARVAAGGKQGAAVTVGDGSRWVLDPAVVGTPSRLGARGVWRFTVTGNDLDRDVFVDDRSGSVLLGIDNHHTAQRVVCDNNNALQNPNLDEPPCVAPFARTETGPASGITDVDNVFTFVGATSDLYSTVGVDLTDMIGKPVASVPGGKAIASTVRLCYSGAGNCPYENAFWNGTEMYYGAGLTVDDVTGHELTHGVTDRTSELLYWGQSGAINESMSDIFGEIVDHRTATPGDAPNDFQLAEESSIGAIRNLADPTLFGDPDRTQSANWFRDLGDGYFYDDNGGVHLNSGVGNKTAYLIMKGGTFNGQTITGLDAANDTMAKTAKLYMQTLPTLASGADYADLGNALKQSCQVLVATPASGFTAGDCTEVNKVTLATELAITPANAAQPADAPDTCPAGQTKTVLFDSETGTPATKFTSTAANWSRADDPYWGSNAHSGQDSWNNATPFSESAMTPHTESLVTTSPIAVPATGTTYLHFQGWYSLDFGLSQPSGTFTAFYDGGTVEVDDLGDASAPIDVANQTWVNGPTRTISSSFSSPAAGRKAFAGDSFGWTASRLDLASFAGKNIKPQFSLQYDDGYTYVGWFVDDVVVYNCAVPVSNTAPVVDAGSDASVTVNTPFTSSGSFTDDAPAGATATVDYGDGSGVQALTLTGTTFNLSHTYTTTGAKTVTVTVTDAGSLSDSDTATVTVNPVANTAPVVNAGPDATVSAGSAFSSSGSFTDDAPAGATATVDYGDGSGVQALTLTGTTFNLSHTYTTAGAKTVTVSVTDAGSLSGSDTATVTVNAVTPPPVPTVTVGTVTIKGKTIVGKKLKAKVAGWAPSGLTYTYEWLRNGKVIKGATAKKYLLVAKDLGKKIQVRVTGSKTGYTSGVATSKKTGKIQDA